MQALFKAVFIAAVSLFLTSGFMYTYIMLIVIKQWILNLIFSMAYFYFGSRVQGGVNFIFEETLLAISLSCLIMKQKWKNVPSRSEQWFKRRTWLEEPGLLYITWTINDRILNMSGSQCWQISLDMCNSVNMLEYSWNITCLNKTEF